MTNLTLDTVELFQVLNYGIGGHYEPHYDFARPSEINTFEEWRGNRIATVIFYMSDLEAGGSNRLQCHRSGPTAGERQLYSVVQSAQEWRG
jgi:hypothetical protein